MAVSEPPWRRRRPLQFPGLPAWSMPATAARSESFSISALPGIDPEWAWGGADGSGVTVAVLDSGVDGTHQLVAPIARGWQRQLDIERNKLFYGGVFNDLTVPQAVGLLSAFVFEEKGGESQKLPADLQGPLRTLQETARRLALEYTYAARRLVD